MAQACYVRHDNTRYVVSDQLPCSNTTTTSSAVLCCSGSDTCGLDGFCHFTHAQDNPVTGYYMGGCTDPNFEAAACPQHCTSYGTQDVIYTPDNGLWSCCWGSGELDCRHPSNETFAAPGPEALFVVGTASASASASATTAKASGASRVASTTSSTFTAATTSSSAGHSSSSDDTTTTIATAVTVPVVVILATVLGFFLWRRKQRRRRGSSKSFAQPNTQSKDAVDASHQQQQQYRSEQPNMAAAPKFELPADRERGELSAKVVPKMRASELQG